MTDRIKQIDGAVNLRDFGGYATGSGKVVRRDALYRCGTLAYLTEQGIEQFSRLGVGLICDLRRPDEKEDEPTPPSVPGDRLEIPIDPGSAVTLRARLRDTGLGYAERIDFMTSLTHELTRDHADDYAHMFESLLTLDDGGFLVHCSAGKDRTGVACALILHALGVPRTTVMDDYLLTNQAIDYEGFVLPRMAKRFGSTELIDKELVMTMAGVRAEYLSAAYVAIEDQFDDVTDYIGRALRLRPEHFAALQTRYLTD